MTKKTKIIVGGIAFLCITCGLMWCFTPVHFLQEMESEEVAMVMVYNGKNEDVFATTNPDDISYIVNNIKEITFRENRFDSEIDTDYYILTFLGEDGEIMDSIGIQNDYLATRGELFYPLRGEPDIVVEYLDHLAAMPSLKHGGDMMRDLMNL